MAKNILITGTSSGFGRDTAETLAKAGHSVFATMRNTTTRNKEKAEALSAKGIQVVELDVTDDGSVERGVKTVLEQAGRIDVVVNNAGIGALGISETFTAMQFQELYNVNVFGVQRVLTAVLPGLRAQGSGLVINIGSVFGRIVMPFFGLYGSSKFALEAISDSYRYELSQFGVDVVLIQPSAYPTDIFASSLQPADTGRIPSYGQLSEVPGKVGQSITDSFKGDNPPNPHDVAEAILKLVAQNEGSRPARVVVGQPFGADHLNGQAEGVQSKVMETVGLSFLETHPSAPAKA